MYWMITTTRHFCRFGKWLSFACEDHELPREKQFHEALAAQAGISEPMTVQTITSIVESADEQQRILSQRTTGRPYRSKFR